MINVLATVIPLLFFVSAPALLFARWFSPTRVSWLTVVVLTACLGWVLLVANEHVQDVAYEQCLEKKLQAPVEGMTESIDSKCASVSDHRVQMYYQEFGWLWTLLYLSPWLVAYGAAQLVRKRRGVAKHA